MRKLELVTLALGLLCLPVVADADDFKREGTGPKREAKNALEGKAPPAFVVKDWMNTEGKALKLSDLKGKVIVLDFWGTW